MRYYDTESSVVELKRSLPSKDQIIKTAIGFCNQNGGKIVIGVADDRSIVGLSEKEIEAAMEYIDKSLYDACAPHILPRIYTQRFVHKQILIIEISEGMNKPYYRRSEGLEKGTYIRLGRHTLRATAEIIQELQWQSIGVDFENLPVYQATIEDLDLDKFKHFLGARKNHGQPELSQKMLEAYNILISEHTRHYPTVAGLLLFGRRPQKYLSEAMIICTHFQGTSGREVIATVDCNGTLFEQFQQAYAFIIARLYRSFTIEKLKREEELEVPEKAIREALLNAIVHRNYHIKAPSKIAIYDDQIEFFTPGQFPGPLDTRNLKSGITYLRNPIICKILREASYIEKLGTGFITIFETYKERGLREPQVIEGENYVKCILPRKDSLEIKGKDDLAKILDLFNVSPEINVKDVMRHLSVSRTTAARKLNELIKKSYVERMGKTKATRYRKK